jgi:hypothetical protein
LLLVGELDEDVFEAGRQRANLGDGNPIFEKLLTEIVQIEMVLDQRMDGLSENGGAADTGDLAGKSQSAGDFGGGDLDA